MDPSYHEEGSPRRETTRQVLDPRHHHGHHPQQHPSQQHPHQQYHPQQHRGPPSTSHRPTPGFAQNRYGHPHGRPRGPPPPQQYHMDAPQHGRPRDTYYGDFSYSDYADDSSNTSHEQWPLGPRPRQTPSPGPNPNHARRPPRRPQRPPMNNSLPASMNNSLPVSMIHPAERQHRGNPHGEWAHGPGQPSYAMRGGSGGPRSHRGPPQHGHPPHRPHPAAPRSVRRGSDLYRQRHASVHSIAEEASDSPVRGDDMIGRPVSPGSMLDTAEVQHGPEDVSRRVSSTMSHDTETLTAESYPDSSEPEGSWTPDAVEPTILRHASLGKKSRPTLTTIQNADRSRHLPSLSRDTNILDQVPTADEHEMQREDSNTVPPFLPNNNADEVINHPLPPPPALLASHPSTGGVSHRTESSEALVPRVLTSSDSQTTTLTPSMGTRFSESTATSQDSSLDEKDIELMTMSLPNRPMSRTPRAPLRIDVDAIRDAEARGSLTSLSDLIRRATKVASNLDRGKTASRLGLEWFLNSSDNNDAPTTSHRKSQAGSLSDMLDSFPPPAAAGASHDAPASTVRRSFGQMSVHLPGGAHSHARHATLGSDSGGEDAPNLHSMQQQHGQSRRRCCGLPMWGFLLLVALVVLLVVAAVVVPVMLLVVLAPHPTHRHVQN